MSQVDRIIEDLDQSMRRLREAMRGIPVRHGSFKKTHDNLARDVAKVTTMLDAVRPILRKN
jgi:CHASE3 domain sensor protein